MGLPMWAAPAAAPCRRGDYRRDEPYGRRDERDRRERRDDRGERERHRGREERDRREQGRDEAHHDLGSRRPEPSGAEVALEPPSAAPNAAKKEVRTAGAPCLAVLR